MPRLASGDLCWLFNWDSVNPLLVHVQIAENVRDPKGVEVWLNYGTLVGEFSVGESVTVGDKNAGVVHWVHSSGTVLRDGVSTPSYGAQLTLTSVVGSFAVGDQLVGAVSGATGTIGGTSPITSNIMKSAFDVDWTPVRASVARRAWGWISSR